MLKVDGSSEPFGLGIGVAAAERPGSPGVSGSFTVCPVAHRGRVGAIDYHECVRLLDDALRDLSGMRAPA